MIADKRDKTADRKGVALVIVLGFLAILTLMAVGMAISMRTERLASRSYMDMVQARMFCQSALAYSMQDMEDYLTSLNDPEYKLSPAFINSFSQHGDWVLPSYEKDCVGPPDMFTNSLIEGTGTNFAPYIPGLCWPVLAESGRWQSIGSVYREAEWIHTTRELASGQTVTNGRFMYLIFDNTVGIDMNLVGKNDPFGFRMSGDYIKCFVNGESFSEFTNNRIDHVRYDTLKDIRNANDLASYGQKAIYAPWSGPSDMTSFSYFPPMGRVAIDLNSGIAVEEMPAQISTNLNEWVESDIKAKLKIVIDQAGWRHVEGAVDEDELYELLVDFVDDDSDPHNAEGVTMEAIPMVSEFMVNTNSLDVEIWSPFVGDDENRYTEEFHIEVKSDTQSYEEGNLTLPAWNRHDRPLDPKTFSINLSSPVTNTLNNVEISVRKSKGGPLLDRVVLSQVEPGRSYQCNDPRFNHLDSQWDDFDSGSPNQINQYSKNGYADNGGAPGAKGYVADGDYLMYCANRPLRCTGELGYLPVAPWRTLKLYEDPRNNTRDLDPVLDYFVMTTNVRHNLVSPNDSMGPHRTHNVALDVGNKVNQGMFRNYLGEPENGPNDSGYFAGRISSYVRSRNVFTNLSDMGMLYGDNIIGKYKGNAPEFSELRLEHFMRRASAVYNLRSSLFIVCMWGQALGTEPQDTGDRYSFPVKAEAQAVALVWRDPYPDEKGEHRKFIRYMRWLE